MLSIGVAPPLDNVASAAEGIYGRDPPATKPIGGTATIGCAAFATHDARSPRPHR